MKNNGKEVYFKEDINDFLYVLDIIIDFVVVLYIDDDVEIFSVVGVIDLKD